MSSGGPCGPCGPSGGQLSCARLASPWVWPFIWLWKGSSDPDLGFPASILDVRDYPFRIRHFLKSKPPPPLSLSFAALLSMDKSRGPSSQALSGSKRGREGSSEAARSPDLEYETALRGSWRPSGLGASRFRRSVRRGRRGRSGCSAMNRRVRRGRWTPGRLRPLVRRWPPSTLGPPSPMV